MELYNELLKLAGIELDEAERVMLTEGIAELKRQYPNISDNDYQQLIRMDPTYKGGNEIGKFGRWILDKYPRALNSSDLKMFVDGDNDMIVLADMLNELNFIRAKYDAVLKSFEVAQWQLTNLVKLQCAGLDGALMPM